MIIWTKFLVVVRLDGVSCLGLREGFRCCFVFEGLVFVDYGKLWGIMLGLRVFEGLSVLKKVFFRGE